MTAASFYDQPAVARGAETRARAGRRARRARALCMRASDCNVHGRTRRTHPSYSHSFDALGCEPVGSVDKLPRLVIELTESWCASNAAPATEPPPWVSMPHARSLEPQRNLRRGCCGDVSALRVFLVFRGEGDVAGVLRRALASAIRDNQNSQIRSARAPTTSLQRLARIWFSAGVATQKPSRSTRS
jgi:hypothetical protein